MGAPRRLVGEAKFKRTPRPYITRRFLTNTQTPRCSMEKRTHVNPISKRSPAPARIRPSYRHFERAAAARSTIADEFS
eukprot:1746091-Prymnesium_polylepis.1